MSVRIGRYRGHKTSLGLSYFQALDARTGALLRKSTLGGEVGSPYQLRLGRQAVHRNSGWSQPVHVWIAVRRSSIAHETH